ncbi:MAG: 4-alpha-glucanotransferase [Acidiferrobacteraceae bacterium]
MYDPDRLAQLCRAYGIDRDYEDTWGQRHEVPRETLEALLAALGVPIEDQAIALEHSAVPHEGLLKAQYVLRVSDSEPTIPLKADRHAGTTLRFEYLRGDGTVERGTVSLPDNTHSGRYWLWAVPFRPELGRRRLTLATDNGLLASTWLIATPDHSYWPPKLHGQGRVWGLAIQLYALRSDRNWGIGDFTDLARVVGWASRLGASIIGINPLHALFLHDPDRASPYSPSSRLFLNPLYIDVEAIPEFQHSAAARARVGDPAFQSRIAGLRAAPWVDYRAAWTLKKELLEILHTEFRNTADTQRRQAFADFKNHRGDALSRHAVYEALQERFFDRDSSVWGWPAWPSEYRHPEAPAVTRFASEHATRVEFFAYLQWQTKDQLDWVSEKARRLLGIGLYRDLAVGVDQGGAEAWSDQDLFVFDATVGCPPDVVNQNGQNWGLPPANPQTLADRGFEPYLAIWDANMAGAGALRIDHVMSLARLFWVPKYATAREGAYVRYPLEPLCQLLAYQSQHHRCLVIGEDLGTVPLEIHRALADFGFLSYRILYFERGAGGAFTRPAEYLPDALVMVTTHDLPTFTGFWLTSDLSERQKLSLFPSQAAAEQQLRDRANDKRQLLDALAREGLSPQDGLVSEVPSVPLMLAVYAYLAKTPARVLLVQMEDLLMMPEAVNLPGTTSERPNWRHKLACPVEDIDSVLLEDLVRIMTNTGRAGPVPSEEPG